MHHIYALMPFLAACLYFGRYQLPQMLPPSIFRFDYGA